MANRRYRQDQHIPSDSSSVLSPDHHLFVGMKIYHHYAPIFQCGHHELMSCLDLWNGHGVGSPWDSTSQEDILLCENPWVGGCYHMKMMSTALNLSTMPHTSLHTTTPP